MATIDDTILTLLDGLAPGKSISPDEVAKAVDAENWRSQLTAVRAAGRRLADAGLIDVLRKGKPVDPHNARGIIRFRLKADDA